MYGRAVIVRASRFQSLNFIGISQIAGAQSEALTTGLPTITIGSHLTPAQHQVVITNSLASGVSSSYQASPLVSTSFHSGMLQPIDYRTFALLIASHQREPVFYLVVDRINIAVRKSIDPEIKNGQASPLLNDPARNWPKDFGGVPASETGAAGANRESTAYCNCKVLGTGCADLGETPWKGLDLYFPSYTCTYSKFVNLLRTLSGQGFTADLIGPDTSSGKRDLDRAQPPPQVKVFPNLRDVCASTRVWRQAERRPLPLPTTRLVCAAQAGSTSNNLSNVTVTKEFPRQKKLPFMLSTEDNHTACQVTLRTRPCYLIFLRT